MVYYSQGLVFDTLVLQVLRCEASSHSSELSVLDRSPGLGTGIACLSYDSSYYFLLSNEWDRKWGGHELSGNAGSCS